MMLDTVKKTNTTLIQNERGSKMETTITNDYYLQFDEIYFLTCGDAKKDVSKDNGIHASNTKIRLLGRKFYKGILKTIAEILVVFSLLAVCKYTGIYDVWVQLAEKMF